MKKVFVLVLFLVSCVSVMNAQFSQFHVGVALPQGDFGDGDVDDDEPFGDGVGFAATGFNVGYKYYNPLSAKNLSLVFALDVFYNGLNSDVKDDFEDAEDAADGDFEYSLPAYLNIPVTLGLNYAHPLSSTIDLYGEVALGFNFSKITDLKIES
ncbi:MAG: hypothetical protein LBP72_07280, partial [Dysgonamonadaceae bacterium]|nr:hypothetical protein [Dysgonamonadaceae bacterium]